MISQQFNFLKRLTLKKYIDALRSIFDKKKYVKRIQFKHKMFH